SAVADGDLVPVAWDAGIAGWGLAVRGRTDRWCGGRRAPGARRFGRRRCHMGTMACRRAECLGRDRQRRTVGSPMARFQHGGVYHDADHRPLC
ncbi:hypothetical protein ABTM21_19645, partial [Acinetobacter baumannii]